MAQNQEVRLVEVPPPPPKAARKKPKKPSLVDQAKVLLAGSPSSVAIFGEYDGGMAKAQIRLGAFASSVREGELDFTPENHGDQIEALLGSTVGKAVAQTVDIDDLASQGLGRFERDVQDLFRQTFPGKAESSAYSAAYQVNLGETKRWSDTDPSLVSEENPEGLKYYAVYRESTNRPGIYERVIGLRSHLPKEWADFVLTAGSRKRLAEKRSEEEQVDPGGASEVEGSDEAGESGGITAAEVDEEGGEDSQAPVEADTEEPDEATTT